VSGAVDLFEHQLRPARAAPDGALVLLHGRGTDRFDLLPLIDELDPNAGWSALRRRRLWGCPPAAGTRVLYCESRMFHGIDPVFVHVLQNWLAGITMSPSSN
jgi:hypothetical protein